MLPFSLPSPFKLSHCLPVPLSPAPETLQYARCCAGASWGGGPGTHQQKEFLDSRALLQVLEKSGTSSKLWKENPGL